MNMNLNLHLVPRHMRSPGDDGYRTPTIEDAERTLPILGGPEIETRAQVHSTALQRFSSRATDRIPREREREKEKETGKRESNCLDHNHNHNNNNLYDLHRSTTESSASTLSWKKRIRHVTWAYFTSTMATGGLANVLYQGTISCATPSF